MLIVAVAGVCSVFAGVVVVLDDGAFVDGVVDVVVAVADVGCCCFCCCCC